MKLTLLDHKGPLAKEATFTLLSAANKDVLEILGKLTTLKKGSYILRKKQRWLDM